tara:strand:+ start:62 stop:193 length:132 start_codon:yes stop_codon:yes gene_type:complete
MLNSALHFLDATLPLNKEPFSTCPKKIPKQKKENIKIKKYFKA